MKKKVPNVLSKKLKSAHKRLDSLVDRYSNRLDISSFYGNANQAKEIHKQLNRIQNIKKKIYPYLPKQ
jgi:Na+/phosphate symporter